MFFKIISFLFRVFAYPVSSFVSSFLLLFFLIFSYLIFFIFLSFSFLFLFLSLSCLLYPFLLGSLSSSCYFSLSSLVAMHQLFSSPFSLPSAFASLLLLSPLSPLAFSSSSLVSFSFPIPKTPFSPFLS